MTTDTKAVMRYRAVLSNGLIEVEANPAGSFVLFTDHERVVGEMAPFTYSEQPENKTIWDIGSAVHEVRYAAKGDCMGAGLALLKGLQKAGFGVVEIGKPAALAATGKQQVGEVQVSDFDDEELQFYREEVGNLDSMLCMLGVMKISHEGDYTAAWKNTYEAIERLAARQRDQT